MTGGALATVSVQERGTAMANTFDMPPPGGGLKTTTDPLPTALTSAIVKVTAKMLVLTNCVSRDVPFHSTNEPGTNPEPMTLTLIPAEPASTHAGLRLAMTGTGFGGGGGATRRIRLLAVSAMK